MSDQKYTCPCCSYNALTEPPGSYDICPLCFWEDDKAQSDDPDFEGGANKVSLRQAQNNFHELGAAEPRFLGRVRRPTKEEGRDPHWKPL